MISPLKGANQKQSIYTRIYTQALMHAIQIQNKKLLAIGSNLEHPTNTKSYFYKLFNNGFWIKE